MGISLGVAVIGMALAVLTMMGFSVTVYDLTTGGYLRGAQTLLLLVVALYCLKKSV